VAPGAICVEMGMARTKEHCHSHSHSKTQTRQQLASKFPTATLVNWNSTPLNINICPSAPLLALRIVFTVARLIYF